MEMTKKIYLETLKSALHRSIYHYLSQVSYLTNNFLPKLFLCFCVNVLETYKGYQWCNSKLCVLFFCSSDVFVNCGDNSSSSSSNKLFVGSFLEVGCYIFPFWAIYWQFQYMPWQFPDRGSVSVTWQSLFVILWGHLMPITQLNCFLWKLLSFFS